MNRPSCGQLLGVNAIMKTLSLAAVGALALVAASPSVAAVTVANTGSAGWTAASYGNSASAPTAAAVAAGKFGATYVTPSNPFYGVPNGASSWISPTASGISTPGWYAYKVNAVATSVADVLDFQYGVDDTLVRVFLNGAIKSTDLTGSYSALTSASVSGFNVGNNTLTFLVQNNFAGQNNPSNLTAFRFQSSVPEPTSWALMLVGFGVVGASLRARRSAKVTFA